MRRRLLPLVFLSFSIAFAARAEDPKKDPLPSRIKKALARAAKALAQTSSSPPITQMYDSRTLVALALVRAGGHDERAAARKLLDKWWEAAVKRRVGHAANYELALGISALEGLSLERVDSLDADPDSTVTRFEAVPLEPEVKRRLEVATRALVDGRMNDPQGPGAAWGYRTARFKEGDGKTKEKEKESEPDGEDGPFLFVPSVYDNSNAQFSVLALHDAARGGIAVSDDIVKSVGSHFLGCKLEPAMQGKPGVVRWAYRDRGWSPSMTFAALSSLAVVRELGEGRAAVAPVQSEVLAAIEGGLKDLAELVPLCGTPKEQDHIPGWGCPYNFYSLEKALDLLDVKELDGKDWFAPLAEQVLAAQGSDGLWGHDAVDTSLYVLFLVRATVPRTRVLDHRTRSEGGASPGEVFLPSKKKTVDAAALVRAYGAATDVKGGLAARAEASEAIEALLGEGHGRDACLLGPLEDLAKTSGKRETALAWLREIAGREVKQEEASKQAALARSLLDAREKAKIAPLRAALEDEGVLLPVRAFAAHALSTIPFPQAAGDIALAAERLADDRLLSTPAGARCARAYSDALSALVRSRLPVIQPKGDVAPADLRALALAAKDATKKVLEESVERALAAWPSREKEAAAWQKAKADVLASGDAALRRLVAIAADEPSRAATAYPILRALTGEFIPDDVESWKAYLDSKKK